MIIIKLDTPNISLLGTKLKIKKRKQLPIT